MRVAQRPLDVEPAERVQQVGRLVDGVDRAAVIVVARGGAGVAGAAVHVDVRQQRATAAGGDRKAGGLRHDGRVRLQRPRRDEPARASAETTSMWPLSSRDRPPPAPRSRATSCGRPAKSKPGGTYAWPATRDAGGSASSTGTPWASSRCAR